MDSCCITGIPPKFLCVHTVPGIHTIHRVDQGDTLMGRSLPDERRSIDCGVDLGMRDCYCSLGSLRRLTSPSATCELINCTIIAYHGECIGMRVSHRDKSRNRNLAVDPPARQHKPCCRAGRPWRPNNGWEKAFLRPWPARCCLAPRVTSSNERRFPSAKRNLWEIETPGAWNYPPLGESHFR